MILIVGNKLLSLQFASTCVFFHGRRIADKSETCLSQQNFFVHVFHKICCLPLKLIRKFYFWKRQQILLRLRKH